MDFSGTRTEENIKAAFAGESQARNRYTYFAAQAHNEGNQEIADLFERMAKNELTHAQLWFKIMNHGLGDSLTNLQQAAAGENYEWLEMYPQFAEDAREEGFEEIAELFEKVASIESDHEHTFLRAFVKMQSASNGTPHVEAPVKKPAYRCMFCGATSETYQDVCPVCEAIGAYELTGD